MLNWSASDLAENSGVSVSTIRRFEAGDSRDLRQASVDRLWDCIEQNGLRFIVQDAKASGVRRMAAAR